MLTIKGPIRYPVKKSQPLPTVAKRRPENIFDQRDRLVAERDRFLTELQALKWQLEGLDMAIAIIAEAS